MSAFSLAGRLSLDARDFVAGARKAEKSVEDIGDAFGDLPDEARAGARKASDQAERELGKLPDGAGRTGKLAGTNLGSKMIAGFAALGVGAILLDSITAGMDTQRMVAKVNNAFRRTPEEAAKQGKIAGKLYADAWGSSLGELEHNVALTSRRITGLSDDALADVTMGAQAIADTFGEEYERVIRSVGQLLENDLAPSAEAALDIVTAGFQDGANEAGDWLDTIDEYSQHFEAVGLSGQDMAEIITHGLQNGQRDADKMADAIKEMRIRIVENSEPVREALSNIGVDADRAIAAFIEGGPAARDAFNEIIGALHDAQSAGADTTDAVAILGTQFEDLGPKALESFAQIADGQTDIAGRNQELIDGINAQISEYDKLSRRVSAFYAQASEEAAGWANSAIDGLDDWFSTVGDMGDAFGALFGQGDRAERQLNKATREAIDLADTYGRSLEGEVTSFKEAREAALLHSAALDMGTESTVFANRAATVWAETTGNTAEQLAAARRELDQDTWAKQVPQLEAAADATGDLGDETGDLVDEQRDLAAALEEARAQLEEYVSSQRRAADAALNAREAQFDFGDALDDARETLADQETTMREAARAYDDVVEAAAKAADATVQLEQDTAAAAGQTVSAVEEQDAWNQSMLASAATADGKLREAIIAYIGEVNDIPEAQMTDIQALIDQGKLDEANEALEDVSKTRTALVNAEAWTGDAEQELNWVARNRSTVVSVRTVTSGGAGRTAFAKGTRSAPGGIALVGEQGPELVNLPRGSQVFTAAETQRMMTGPTTSPAGSSESTTFNMNVTIDGFVTEQSMQQLHRAIDEIERRKMRAS